MKRALTSLTAAALFAVAVPSPSQAVVPDRPTPSFPRFDNIVRTIAHRGSTVYVGGDFDHVTDRAGSYVRHGAAAIDAKTGRVLPWNPSVHGEVRDLAVGKEGVYLVGSFSRVKKFDRHNVARVSRVRKGKVARRFHPNANAAVNVVTLTKTKVLLGGEFTAIGKTDRKRLAAVPRSRPYKVAGWAPMAQNGSVMDIVKAREGIYVAGEFRSLNGRPADARLALVTGKTGATRRSFNPPADKIIYDIALSSGRVFAAEGGLQGGGALSFARADGRLMWDHRFDGDVQAITKMGDQVYVGGHFTRACADANQQPNGTCNGAQTPRLRGASLTMGGALSGWDPRADSDLGIYTFNTYAGQDRLLVGGAFTHMNGVVAGRFAVFG